MSGANGTAITQGLRIEPVPGSETEYRFTGYGLEHRQDIVETEQERIERERYEPPERDLSEPARERLRRYLEGNRAVTPDNRVAYRELVGARVMIPVHTFSGGRDAEYRFT